MASIGSNVTLCVAMMVTACAKPTPFDPDAEAAKLLAQDAEWSALAFAGKDVERTISYWSDDAVLLPQGQPAIEGKQAIRAFVTQAFQLPGFSIRWQSETPTFSPDGKFAYMRGSSITTEPGPDGSTITLLGRAVTIWRLEPDGRWRCVMDIWNDPPAAASAT
jgi:ketosteroid isomerase-like protein